MEKIQIRCEHCSTLLAVPQTAGGKKIRCPKCQGIILVTVDNVRPVPQRNQDSPAASDQTMRQSHGEDSRSSDRKNQRQQANAVEMPRKINALTLSASQAPPDASSGWYYQIMGDIFGPIGASEILQHFEKGRLEFDTLVKRTGDESWGELQGFLSVLRAPQPPPIRIQEPRHTPVVEQLDNTLFLVEDLPIDDVFLRLKDAAGQDHAVTGAFSRSGLIRGTGASGITFVIAVKTTDEGVTFLLEGETPDGPANFGAIFDPTSGEGWGLLAATALFNSAVNSSAANNIQTDFRTLLMNLLSAFDAEHLLLGDTPKSPPIEVASTHRQLSQPPVDTSTKALAFAKNQLTTTLPLPKVIALIMKVLQQPPASSPISTGVIKFLSFKGDFKANNVQWNGQEITAQIPMSGASWGYNVVIPVIDNSNGICKVNVTLTRINPLNVLDLGQMNRTLKAMHDAIREAIAAMEKKR